jgi:hypothetical protein
MPLNDFQKRQVRCVIKNAINARKGADRVGDTGMKHFCHGQYLAYVNAAKHMAWAFSFGGGK